MTMDGRERDGASDGGREEGEGEEKEGARSPMRMDGHPGRRTYPTDGKENTAHGSH